MRHSTRTLAVTAVLLLAAACTSAAPATQSLGPSAGPSQAASTPTPGGGAPARKRWMAAMSSGERQGPATSSRRSA